MRGHSRPLPCFNLPSLLLLEKPSRTTYQESVLGSPNNYRAPARCLRKDIEEADDEVWGLNLGAETR